MANNADGLTVSYASLDAAAAQIKSEASALDSDLQELRQMVVASHQYWQGEAAGEFGSKLKRWDKEAGDIHTALSQISQVVAESQSTYHSGDKRAAGFFGS
ncbi:WXG100 family type VII secretion target [Streptomyces sp. VRA16 Mangrove soil]|uniref:WXG100 family type VII secretion target n=1 Tax=Streptomyces sp. VRA16 Mangrove soil TaxID=2817434 RepID=UPI001A9EF291|nr:WXG100 family type VII secretion target [Streptomyces sp. VRA16 Mangrove soil]MBO1336046.1 WXG100 family type VII secretion target [Streptomyces sp. VRA16 Mangrove soil]